MKLRNIFLLILLAVPFGTIALAQEAAPNTWEEVGLGIEYQKFRLNDPVPVDVFVARLDRSNGNATIESSIAQGRLSGGTETVSNMAARYDDALNFWGPPTIPVSSTWGSTNDVVVAINGFYYGAGIEPSGVPWSGQIHSGWYAKRFYDNESSSGFIWKMDRGAFIGGCVSHPEDKQSVYTTSGDRLFIDGVNEDRNDNELILYTPQYDRDTGTDNSGTEVLVEMERPTHTSVFGNMPYGIVRRIHPQGSTPIPFDHVVLSGEGDIESDLISKISIGDRVGIAQRVKDCTSEPTTNVWDLAYAGIGGHWRFLRNGVIFPYTNDGQAVVRDPRTAIAYNAEHIFFIVADGRNLGVSAGMTVAEMAAFAKNTLGATDGIMQDGGGSSTMVINGVVVNNSYCNNVVCTPKIYIPLVVKSASGTQTVSQPQTPAEPLVEWDAEALILQRLVANGMLMVEVQPVDKSTTVAYDPGDPVATIGTVDVRLGPGTNYAVLTSLNDDGTIMAPLNQMGGVFAKGSYWWKVDFGSIEGWVAQEGITAQLKLRDTDNLKDTLKLEVDD